MIHWSFDQGDADVDDADGAGDRDADGHVVPVQNGALIIDVLDLHTILCLQRGKKSECRIFKHR